MAIPRLRRSLSWLAGVVIGLLASTALANDGTDSSSRVGDGVAEARLIEVFKLVGAGQTRVALSKAEALTRDSPNFQLAQLVHGDLLATRGRPVARFGDVPEQLGKAAAENLQDLRSEAQLRVAALQHRPPKGTVPAQFLKLSGSIKHAIAVDVSRARLYLFEHRAGVVNLVADYYISVGKAGVGKLVEGDQRTPLGLYFITSSLDPRKLQDLYGAGALPINYPNAYDVRLGRTGGGIWLHGTPSEQFSRPPRATDGCVAVANPDLLRIVKTVETGSTPVLIAQRLSWVSQHTLHDERAAFEAMLQQWAAAKSSGNATSLAEYYAADFSAEGKSFATYQKEVQKDPLRLAGRAVSISDLSVLGWSDDAQVRVVTFGETASGSRRGQVIRQYWERRDRSWKIVYETSLWRSTVPGSAPGSRKGEQVVRERK